MSLEKYLGIPEVKQFVRRIPAGDYLFKQGQSASSMFIVVSGTVALLAEEEDTEHLQGLLGTGEFLGEKALLSDTPYQRRYSAMAKSETTVLEIAARDITTLQKAAPEMIPEMFKGILDVTSRRLDRANYLVRALRPADRFERFLALVQYFCRTAATRSGPCIELELSPDNISYFIEMEEDEIHQFIGDLVNHNVLVRNGGSRYLVPSEMGLIEYHRNLKAGKAA